MSQSDTTNLPLVTPDQVCEADDKYLVRNPRQVKRLLQALIDQRATVIVQPAGRAQSFTSAILKLSDDPDWMLLDGSLNEASNRAAEQSSQVLCSAQISYVQVRFQAQSLHRITEQGRVAFRAPLPQSLHHMQRREAYRLQTPLSDPPLCVLRISGSACAQAGDLEVRVTDISSGGMAVALVPNMPPLITGATYRQCQLKLPGQQPIALSVTICSQASQTLPAGPGHIHARLQFSALPRGAEEVIQRYILRMERQRSARNRGVF